MPAEPARPYHHGDLRPELLRAAVEGIGQAGPAAMRLREDTPRAPPPPTKRGDRRHTLLRAAGEVIGQAGPAAMSLREVARRAGVSHAAAAYHFGDKAGLLTAVATQGKSMLTEETRHHHAH